MIGSTQQEEKAKGEGQTSPDATVCDTVQSDDSGCVIHSADKNDTSDWTFLELAVYAKQNKCDMIELLKGKVSITEIIV